MQKRILALAVAGAMPQLPLPRFAEFGPVESDTYQAAADLSDYQYRVVRGSALRAVNVASESANNAVLGVLQNDPRSGEAATVGVFGRSKVTAAGSLGPNTLITTNGSGKATTATSGAFVFGRTIDAATADNDVIQCRLLSPFRLSS